MQTMKLKPPHLKGHFLKHRSKTEYQEEPRSRHKKKGKLDDIIRIRSIGCDGPKRQPSIHAELSNLPSQPQWHRTPHKKKSIQQLLQLQLMTQAYRYKDSDGKFGKWHFHSLKGSKRQDNDANSLTDSSQLQSMRPTDRFFLKMKRFRLAQRLLLSKPSKQINHQTQQKFYQQQETCKINITKPSHRIHDTNSVKMKHLHRKKWID